MILGCTGMTFRRTISDPVMTAVEMQAELERLHEVNLNVGSEDFDPTIYPVFVGVDVRNGKTLINKFICWDDCPDTGMVFLLYQDVAEEVDCLNSIGSPLISPEPIPGEYWGCRPIIDWLTVPSRRPN